MDIERNTRRWAKSITRGSIYHIVSGLALDSLGEKVAVYMTMQKDPSVNNASSRDSYLMVLKTSDGGPALSLKGNIDVT